MIKNCYVYLVNLVVYSPTVLGVNTGQIEDISKESSVKESKIEEIKQNQEKDVKGKKKENTEHANAFLKVLEDKTGKSMHETESKDSPDDDGELDQKEKLRNPDKGKEVKPTEKETGPSNNPLLVKDGEKIKSTDKDEQIEDCSIQPQLVNSKGVEEDSVGKIKVYGTGLETGVVNKENVFTIETRGAGTGGIGLSIEGPGDVAMTFKDKKNGSGTVCYIPDEAGTYIITVTFNEKQIANSPFEAYVTSE